MSFIIIAAAMFLAAVGFIAIPLLRQRRAASMPLTAVNEEIRAARLEELRADVAAGDLAQSDYEAARRDLEADFSDTAEEPEIRLRSRGWIAALVVAAIVPLLTAALYLNLGSWRSALYGDDSLSAMTANVTRRLEKAPNDVSGWEFLGQAYSGSGQYEKAADAWRHVVALTGGENANALSALGAAEMFGNKMQAGPEQAQLFDKVLKLDPTNAGGLLFGGIVAMQRGDKATAIDRWQRLLKQNPPAPLRKILAARIVAAGGTLPAVKAAPAAPAAAIQVEVKLAAAVKAQVPDPATLFVFIRPATSAGGPPLAVRRLNVDQFPVKVQLSDADSMIPGRHLEDYKNLRIVARISKSGAPLQHAGDIFGSAEFAWNARAASLDIVLNQVAGSE
ncbi:MAG TPA: c-type cytochrome biogenesis protein CcmI [Gammaproteobacteria bacterium]|nr:c-type cytochrome biogenesis protein CcmI [Gammaproteobacteria bacterium]